MRLCSSSTNRIRSGSADSSRTSFRMRSSYWPRNVVPARRATWSSATTRTSFKAGGTSPAASTDRKSTRLNSSHDQISYAVFCLKKKNTNIQDHRQEHNRVLAEALVYRL